MGDEADGFGLFVSCVEGSPVARFGSKILIGADRDPSARTLIRYLPKVIVGIPHDEARKYAREYRRAIENGTLTARTADAWREQQNQLREVGAPREQLTADPDTEPPEDEAKEEPDAHSEGSRKFR